MSGYRNIEKSSPHFSAFILLFLVLTVFREINQSETVACNEGSNASEE